MVQCDLFVITRRFGVWGGAMAMLAPPMAPRQKQKNMQHNYVRVTPNPGLDAYLCA
jgi:hypothetical protein